MSLTLLCLLQVAVCCICLFVILPLNLVGTILGRNLSGQPNFPCRVNAVPRPIPEKKWWASAELGVVGIKWQNLKPENGHTNFVAENTDFAVFVDGGQKCQALLFSFIKVLHIYHIKTTKYTLKHPVQLSIAWKCLGGNLSACPRCRPALSLRLLE